MHNAKTLLPSRLDAVSSTFTDYSKISPFPANSASGTRLPPGLEIPHVPQSGKQPVHDPKSPTQPEGCPPPHMEGGSDGTDRNPDLVPVQVAGREGHRADVEPVVESTKEARMPIQESPEAKKSPDSSEIEKAEQRPVQESEDPKKSMTDTTITDEEIMEGGKEARQPTQETSDAERTSPDSSEIEKAEQRPVQESEDPKNSMSDTTITDEEIMEGGKEARQPTQETSEVERPSPNSSEIEKAEQRPVQESEDPKNSMTDTTITDEEIEEGGKEARQPTQEISEAEIPPDSSEIETAEQRPVQESEDPKNSIEDAIAENEITTDDNETRQPTQATSDAETLSADVSELENMKEKPVQESENPKSSSADTPTMEDGLTKAAPVQESEEPAAKKDELEDHPVRSVRQVFLEGDLKDSANSVVQTKTCKEEALPTQETMPAGKGPIEETGLEVGVKGQPTDEQQ